MKQTATEFGGGLRIKGVGMGNNTTPSRRVKRQWTILPKKPWSGGESGKGGFF